MLADAAAPAAALGGVMLLIICATGLVLSFCWLLLPFLLLNSMGKLRDEVTRLNTQLAATNKILAAVGTQSELANVHLHNAVEGLALNTKTVEWTGQIAQDIAARTG